MELLGLFANQSAIALDLLASARRARETLAGAGDLVVVAALASAVEALDGDARDACLRLVAALRDVLAGLTAS